MEAKLYLPPLKLQKVGKSLSEAAALEDAPGGCERLIKVGYVVTHEVTCAWGLRSQSLGIVIMALWVTLTGLEWQLPAETRE